MKQNYFFSAFLLLSLQCFAQTAYPPIIWASEIKTVPNATLETGWDFFDMAVEPNSGSVYAAARCYAPSTFPSGAMLTPVANGELLALIKYDFQGNVEWIKDLGFVGTISEGAKICSSVSGGVYITGTFSVQTIDFGNGVFASRNCATDCDELFIAKYSATGEAEWAKTVFGADNTFFNVSGIESDQTGNLWVTGNYQGSLANFGLNFVFNNLPGNNFFLANYNAVTGNPQAVQFPAPDSGLASSIHLAINDSGQMVLAGNLYGTLKFANGLSVGAQSNPGDFYVAGLSPNGNAQWARVIGSSEYLDVLGIDIDEEAQAYLAIDASVNLKLDNSTILTISNNYAGTVLKVGASSFSLPVFIGYDLDNYPIMDVELDHWGIIYTAGTASESVNIGNFTVAVDGCLDGLLTATGSDGVFQWARTVGGTGCEAFPNYYASNIAFDGAGFLHATGLFYEGFNEDGFTVPGTGGIVLKFHTSIVDTEEPFALGHLQISPNPNSGSFSVYLEATPVSNMQLKIFDLSGREVYHQTIHTQQVDVNTALPSGAYVITLQ
ncbi:MAG: T9SS type A sorting domain-containing protein, partial [Saprospiraceae bacterium]|nr:T9SS type A sorting domain-containing protein [Saprospiraceae bacterium]